MVQRQLVIERLLVQRSNRVFRRCVLGKDTERFFPLEPRILHIVASQFEYTLANQIDEKPVSGLIDIRLVHTKEDV